MKPITIFLACLFILPPAFAQVMVDRPGELLELAEQLTLNIQSAETVRDEILAEIDARSEKLRKVEQELQSPGLSRADKLELHARKNKLERDENAYRRQALGVVKTQMDSVFDALENIRSKLEDMQGDETVVDPEVATLFNRYFQVSAQLIRESARGVDKKTLAMLETLEKTLIVSKKSTDFLAKAEERIREYQKIVALYNAKLSYLARGLYMHKNSLEHEKDAITITVTLETADRFMEGLDTEQMERSFMKGLSQDPIDYLHEYSDTGYRPVFTRKANEKLKKYSEGKTIE